MRLIIPSEISLAVEPTWLPVFKGEQLVGMISIGDLVKVIIADQELQIQILEDYVSGG